MGKLNVAVIGCGNIFRDAHRPAYLKMEDVRVAALCALYESARTGCEVRL